MSVKTYATEFECDGCGAIGPADPLRVTEHLSPAPPESWTQLSAGTARVEMRVRSWYVSDLCPACTALTIGELADKVANHLAER